MDEQIIRLDPNGTILVHNCPSALPFAPWGAPKKEPEASEKSATEPIEPQPKILRVLCSDILRLVSSTLRTEIDERRKVAESTTNRTQLVVLNFTFDSLALQHVLKVLHHEAELDPEPLPVEVLAKMAVIVEFWKCHKAFLPSSDRWMKCYKGFPTIGFSREVVLWLLVSTVFQLKPIFDSAATRAIECRTGPLMTLGLPIPQDKVALINYYRCNRIGKLLGHLNEIEHRLQIGTGNEREIDYINLGRLVTDKIQYRVDSDLIQPYQGINIYRLRELITNFLKVREDNPKYRDSYEYFRETQVYHINETLKRALEELRQAYNWDIDLKQIG